MDFFDKIGKKASEAYKVTADKTGKLAKEAKLRMKIGELKSDITDAYKDLGKIIYENHRKEEKEDISKDIEEKCTKIDCYNDEIESLLKQCLELKDKAKCPSCEKEIEKNAKYCPECGEKQEIKEEPAKEVEIVEENNNTDSSDIEETKTEETETEE